MGDGDAQDVVLLSDFLGSLAFVPRQYNIEGRWSPAVHEQLRLTMLHPYFEPVVHAWDSSD